MANIGGTVLGSTKAALGQRPGEKVIQYYHGNIQHGFYLQTYLSSVTTYWADSRVAGIDGVTSPYFVNVYDMTHADPALDYTTLYLSVYQATGIGNLTMGGADVSMFIVGER